MSDKIRIGIIGIGMVGGPFKRWFEEIKGYTRGENLFCYDVDPSKGCSDDVNQADVIFVSVPTPSNFDGSCDTSIVHAAVDSISNGKTIVIKSTVPPGTVEALQRQYPFKRIMFSPEFLTESQVWLDFQKPDRQILGPTEKSYTETKEVLALLPMAPFQRPWSSDYTKKSINATEAELSKYASNVFGYSKVVFGNILADVSYATELSLKQKGIDTTVEYEKIKEVISADSRIGPAWLNVDHGDYCGAGGYCFPKDMNAFIAIVDSLMEGNPMQSEEDKRLYETLRQAVIVLEAIRDYNRSLFELQGLTESEVSKHNHELIVSKRRPIRQG